MLTHALNLELMEQLQATKTSVLLETNLWKQLCGPSSPTYACLSFSIVCFPSLTCIVKMIMWAVPCSETEEVGALGILDKPWRIL